MIYVQLRAGCNPPGKISFYARRGYRRPCKKLDGHCPVDGGGDKASEGGNLTFTNVAIWKCGGEKIESLLSLRGASYFCYCRQSVSPPLLSDVLPNNCVEAEGADWPPHTDKWSVLTLRTLSPTYAQNGRVNRDKLKLMAAEEARLL